MVIGSKFIWRLTRGVRVLVGPALKVSLNAVLMLPEIYALDCIGYRLLARLQLGVIAIFGSGRREPLAARKLLADRKPIFIFLDPDFAAILLTD